MFLGTTIHPWFCAVPHVGSRSVCCLCSLTKKRAMERGIQLTQLTTPAVSRLGQCHNSHGPHFIYIEQNCSTNSNKVRSHHSHIVIVHAAGVSWLSCFLTLKATFGDTKALGSVWTRGITWLCRENLYMEKTTVSKSCKRVKFRLCQWNEMIYTPERQHGTRKWTPEISWQSRFFHHYQVTLNFTASWYGLRAASWLRKMLQVASFSESLKTEASPWQVKKLQSHASRYKSTIITLAIK